MEMILKMLVYGRGACALSHSPTCVALLGDHQPHHGCPIPNLHVYLFDLISPLFVEEISSSKNPSATYNICFIIEHMLLVYTTRHDIDMAIHDARCVTTPRPRSK